MDGGAAPHRRSPGRFLQGVFLEISQGFRKLFFFFGGGLRHKGVLISKTRFEELGAEDLYRACIWIAVWGLHARVTLFGELSHSPKPLNFPKLSLEAPVPKRCARPRCHSGCHWKTWESRCISIPESNDSRPGC